MNKLRFGLELSKAAALACAVMLTLCFASAVSGQTNSKGEQFFIISSVNFQTHQIVLMYPTQLTLVADFTPQTVCVGENGQKFETKDLKAGDTIWAIIKTAKDGTATVLHIREGAMTEAALHKLYLNYPTSSITPPISIPPVNPNPETGISQVPLNSIAPSPQIHPAPMLQGERRPGHPHAHPHGATPYTIS